MLQKHALLLCLAVVAAGAVVHGSTIRRWEAIAPSSGAIPRLHAHAVQLGDYQAEEVPSDIPLKERSVATCRRYVSPTLNQSAFVSVITGPPGAVSTHTPDVCYPSSGYRTVRPPAVQTVDLPGGGTAGYYVAEFERTTATRTERQRVRWAWSADGTWAAPDRPRFAYLRVPELAKLYIVTPVGDADRDAAKDDPPAVRHFVAATFAQYAEQFAGRQ